MPETKDAKEPWLPAVLSLNLGTKDGLKNVTSVGVVTNFAAYLSIFLFPALLNIPQSYILAGIGVAVLLLVRVLLFAADPLETFAGAWPPEPRFFQSQYPSRLLLKMCCDCRDHTRCGDRPLSEHGREYIAIWYENFDSLKSRNPDLRQRTYEKGFTCRCVFYMKYSLLLFFLLGFSTVLVILIHNSVLAHHLKFGIPAAQAVYVVGNLGLWFVVTLLNKPHPSQPTGCWAMWRDICAQHLVRLSREFTDLEKMVCDRHPAPKKIEGRVVVQITNKASDKSPLAVQAGPEHNSEDVGSALTLRDEVRRE